MIGVDLRHPRNAPKQDATVTPWRRMWPGQPDGPIGPGTVDQVYCSHFMEHIPHGTPLITVMNEAWRILKPGGTFTIICPLVGYTDPSSGAPKSNQIGWQPWADPTHVSYWWFPEALLYFCEGVFKPCADYGISTWGPLGPNVAQDVIPALLARFEASNTWWGVRDEWEGHARLVKP